jgi:uncharacterized spore protein YtfJ
MTSYEEAVANARNRAEAGGLIDRLAERVGSNATSRAVFGEPVERDGVTVIPVAKLRWGVGGGGGHGTDEEHHREGEGAGGGAGMMATPVGYIEIVGGEAHFRRIVDLAALWPVFLVGGLAGWLLLRGFRSIFR